MERLKNRYRVTRTHTQTHTDTHTHTHTHTHALRSLCCSPLPASFEHTVKTDLIPMTTRKQVESETNPVSTHPISVNLTSPMLRTQSLCYKALVPKRTQTWPSCMPTRKQKLALPDKACMHLFKISPLFKNQSLCAASQSGCFVSSLP